MRELQGTVLHPGGSVIVDFIAKLKPDLHRVTVQGSAAQGTRKKIVRVKGGIRSGA